MLDEYRQNYYEILSSLALEQEGKGWLGHSELLDHQIIPVRVSQESVKTGRYFFK